MKKAAIAIRQLVKLSGAARNTHEQIRFLVSQGYSVDVFAEKIDAELVKASGGHPHTVRFWPLSGYWKRLYFSHRVEHLWKNKLYDVTFGHGDTFVQDYLFLHNCVHKAHEMVEGKPLSTDHEVGRIHSRQLTEQKFKWLVANSQLMAKDMHQRFQIPKEKITVVYPAYQEGKFNTTNKSSLRQKARQELKIENDDLLVGLITSGNFKKRNLGLFIEALSELKKSLPFSFQALIVAKEKNFSLYRKMIQDRDLQNIVKVAPPRSSVESYYHALDVFTLPARFEEFGRVALEAMACGLPVVLSPSVGSSEILPQESQPFQLQEVSPQTLAQKLTPLLESSELRHHLGNANSQQALKYGELGQAKELERILKTPQR